MRRRRQLIVLSAVLIAAVVGGCGSKVTQANYDRIQIGMSRAEVEDILGEGTAKGGAGFAVPGMSASGMVVEWRDGDKSISVTFLNDKVTLKTQTGL